MVGDLAWGTHIALFYETKEDLLATLVGYFRAGWRVTSTACGWFPLR